MRQVLVDTNVLVSFLTDRDPQQQERSSVLFAAAAEGRHELVLHQSVLTEMVFVLRHYYAIEPAAVNTTLAGLLALPGVVARDEIAWPLVLDLWPKELGSFGDACVAAAAQRCRCDAVATFDRRFAGWLRRNQPDPYW